MIQKHVNFFIIGGCNRFHISIPESFCLSKYPWIPQSSAGDHDPITPGFIQHTHRVFSTHHIAVSDDRDPYCVLHVRDHFPVGTAFVILLPRSSMDSYCRCPCILQRLRSLYCRIFISREAHTDLSCHRFSGMLHHSGYYFLQNIQFFQKCRAFSVFNYFRHRAAHVKVQQGIAAVSQFFCCKGHDFRIAPKELEACHFFRIAYF